MKARKPLLIAFTLLLLLAQLPGCGGRSPDGENPPDYDVIVVGAGMGGLSAATHLAVGGMKVLLLEQHHKVGGCTTSFSRGEFNFEAALHEMSMGGGPEGGVMRILFDKAGIADKIEPIRVPELVRSIFPGVDFTMPGDLEEARAALKARWPHEAEGIDGYFALAEEMAEEVAELRNIYLGNFVTRTFLKLAVPLRQRTLTRYRNATAQEILDEFFVDPEIKAVLAQLWLYQGPPPSTQWGIIFLMMNYSYLLNGPWQFKGSSQALSDAYAERITELGGEVRTRALVTRILVEDGETRGVEIEGGERFTSRYVVSNADPFQTFFELVGEDKTPKRLAKKIRSMKPANSIAGVYLGLDVEASHWGIDEYEIFYNTSMDNDAMYERMMAGDYEDGVLTMTFYTNLGDPFYAPPGKSVLVLHAYSDVASWPERGEGYKAHKRKVTDTLIDMAERLLPGLREHIIVQEGMSPRTLEDYTMNKNGVPYGWDFTVEQSDRLAIPTPIDGLYLAGSWTWPAHAVAMAQTSGYLAAQLILKENGHH